MAAAVLLPLSGRPTASQDAARLSGPTTARLVAVAVFLPLSGLPTARQEAVRLSGPPTAGIRPRAHAYICDS